NVNHSDVGRYGRLASLTVRQEDVTLDLRPVGPNSAHKRKRSSVIVP
ncbi:hypothetical protein A2U01_0101015, partial [Trifolium medium]|nr:hypothetical protein [Trifolium medium]